MICLKSRGLKWKSRDSKPGNLVLERRFLASIPYYLISNLKLCPNIWTNQIQSTGQLCAAADETVVQDPVRAFSLHRRSSSFTPQSFIPNYQFLSLPSHRTLLPLMDQWYKYAFPFTSGFRVKKNLTLPSSSASDTYQVPGGLANPELNRALSTVRHLRNALRWWRGGCSNNEKFPIKLSGLERTSSTTPPLPAWELPLGHCWLPTHREPNPPGSTDSMPLAAAVRFLLFHVFPPALMANALSFRKMTLLSIQVGATHSIYNRSTQLLDSAQEYPLCGLPVTFSIKVLHCLVISFFSLKMKTNCRWSLAFCVAKIHILLYFISKSSFPPTFPQGSMRCK